VRAPLWFTRSLHIVVVSGLTVALAGSVAPSAGATSPHKHHRHHHKHHRHHRKHHVKGVRQSRAVVSQQCPNADTPATSASLTQMRAAVVCLINQERAAHGLPGLRISAKLNRSAQSWNQAMVTSGNFTHGSDFAGRISAVGYDWQTAGENIATGFTTPQSVVDAWMASPDHCRNILDPNFRDVGTGENPAAVGSWATQPSTWTQDFGLLMSQNAPSHNTGPQNGCPY
jgi:uncharacterized protein YkwD